MATRPTTERAEQAASSTHFRNLKRVSGSQDGVPMTTDVGARRGACLRIRRAGVQTSALVLVIALVLASRRGSPVFKAGSDGAGTRPGTKAARQVAAAGLTAERPTQPRCASRLHAPATRRGPERRPCALRPGPEGGSLSHLAEELRGWRTWPWPVSTRSLSVFDGGGNSAQRKHVRPPTSWASTG